MFTLQLAQVLYNLLVQNIREGNTSQKQDVKDLRLKIPLMLNRAMWYFYSDPIWSQPDGAHK